MSNAVHPLRENISCFQSISIILWVKDEDSFMIKAFSSIFIFGRSSCVTLSMTV